MTKTEFSIMEFRMQ